MSTIEPTEEQKQAAFDASDKHGWRAVCKVIDVARLLAEREAKLRERCVCIGVETGRAERDALRARVAELERLDLDRDRALYLAEVEYFAASAREAQHLADIKALMEVLNDGLNDPNDIGEEAARDAAEALLQRLAHYDDAKADAPSVCRPDDNACGYCSMCKASTEGGEG